VTEKENFSGTKKYHETVRGVGVKAVPLDIRDSKGDTSAYECKGDEAKGGSGRDVR